LILEHIYQRSTHKKIIYVVVTKTNVIGTCIINWKEIIIGKWKGNLIGGVKHKFDTQKVQNIITMEWHVN
jgi:hypothetical protein